MGVSASIQGSFREINAVHGVGSPSPSSSVRTCVYSPFSAGNRTKSRNTKEHATAAVETKKIAFGYVLTVFT